jgi:hypothetical protein
VIFLAEAEQQCEQDSSNDVYSCFPTSSTIVPQHETITFVCSSHSFAPPPSLSLSLFQSISSSYIDHKLISLQGTAGYRTGTTQIWLTSIFLPPIQIRSSTRGTIFLTQPTRQGQSNSRSTIVGGPAQRDPTGMARTFPDPTILSSLPTQHH